jgi:predicted SAM-dependent methyltransferase
MKLVKNNLGHINLLMWRTESIFFNQERRSSSAEWNNVRFTSLPYPSEPNLINSGLTTRLPYADHSFDAIYSFHVFEHLSYDEGLFALKEMHRVLKPGGICRISTPDLLAFSKEYVRQAELHSQGESSDFRYNWALLNVIDQAVRKKSGGRMIEALRAADLDREYLKKLNGDSLAFMLNLNPTNHQIDSVMKPSYFDGKPAPVWFRLKKVGCGILRKIIHKLSPLPAVEITGERDRWLYDHISLSRLYSEAGFSEIILQDYKTSEIEEWHRYNYDISVFGDYPLEPSLYMEGRK